jgi:hypothetical protein
LPPFIINGENAESDPHFQIIPENNGPIKKDLPPNPPKKNMNSPSFENNKNTGEYLGVNEKDNISEKDRGKVKGRGSDKGSDRGSDLDRSIGRVNEKCNMVNKGNKSDRSSKRDSSSEHKDGGGEEEGGDDNDDDGESESFIVTTDASGNNSQMVLLPKKGNAQGKTIAFYMSLLYFYFIFLFYN